MKEIMRIDIPSHPKYLSVVRDVTERLGRVYGMDHKLIGDIKLAIDEACSNVIKHSYKGDTSKKIKLTYEINREFLKVIIDDNGLKADMKSLKGRSLDDVRPGGLGIHFIEKIFDIFRLDETKKRGNRLVLIKYFR
jgi:anti-sigma regulatory factor (Ser/Thr protein kinase)